MKAILTGCFYHMSPEEKLNKLERLIQVIDESVTQDEFVKAFELVIKIIQETKNTNEKEFDLINKSLEVFKEKLTNDITFDKQAYIDDLKDHALEITKELANKFRLFEERVRNIKDGQPGKDADENKIAAKVLALLPPQPEPLVGEDMRNALESLKGDERLDKSAIRGLDDLERVASSRPGWGAHPLTIQDDGSTVSKNTRVINFENSAVTVSRDGVVTVTPAGSGGNNTIHDRPPTVEDNASLGYETNDLWLDQDGVTWKALSVDPNGLWVRVDGGPKRPLDGYTAPVVAYGTKLLRTAYQGYALQLTRASDSATFDVAFLQNDEMDYASADNFCYGTTCEITKWYDQSGNGRDATGTVGTSPVWDATKDIKGCRVVSFQSRKHAISGSPGVSLVDQYLVMPSTVSYEPALSSALMVVAHNNPSTDADEGGLFSNSTGAFGFAQSYQNGTGIRGVGFAGTMDTHLTTTPSVAMITCAASFFYLHMNGQFESQGHPNTTTTSAGGYIGYDAVNGGACMSLGAFVLWNSTLSTTSTEPTVIKSFEATFNIQRQANNIVLVASASDGAGTSSTTGSSWPFMLEPLLPKGTRIYNNSNHGFSIDSYYADRVNRVGNVYTSNRGATMDKFIIVFTLIGNDIRGGDSIETIKTNLQNFVSYAKGLGSNVYVIVTTKEVDCSFAAGGGSNDKAPVLQAYNSWIESSYNVPIASGGVGADAYVDRNANQLVSDGSYVTALMCNTDISFDGIHLRDPYQATMAQMYAKKINDVLEL